MELEYLNSISAIDYVGHFELVYHLTSFRRGHKATIKSRLPGREDLSAPSVYHLWRGADFQEREIWDLMGIRFRGASQHEADHALGGIRGASPAQGLHGMTIRTEPMTVNIGPQHPSTHGVFRLRVTFDGEEILQVEPVFGYLHRGTEKLAEERNYTQVVTLTDRLDYVSSMINNQAYCLAVEQLLRRGGAAAGEIPPDTLTAELQRIAAHLMGIGFIIQDLGALGTPLMYCFRSRERILDLFEMLCGARITVSYMRPGGVYFDTPTRVLAGAGPVPRGFRGGIQGVGAASAAQRNRHGPHQGSESTAAGRGHQLLGQRAGAAGQRDGMGTGARLSRMTPMTWWSSTYRLPRTATTTPASG